MMHPPKNVKQAIHFFIFEQSSKTPTKVYYEATRQYSESLGTYFTKLIPDNLYLI